MALRHFGGGDTRHRFPIPQMVGELASRRQKKGGWCYGLADQPGLPNGHEIGGSTRGFTSRLCGANGV